MQPQLTMWCMCVFNVFALISFFYSWFLFLFCSLSPRFSLLIYHKLTRTQLVSTKSYNLTLKTRTSECITQFCGEIVNKATCDLLLRYFSLFETLSMDMFYILFVSLHFVACNLVVIDTYICIWFSCWLHECLALLSNWLWKMATSRSLRATISTRRTHFNTSTWISINGFEFWPLIMLSAAVLCHVFLFLPPSIFLYTTLNIFIVIILCY